MSYELYPVNSKVVNSQGKGDYSSGIKPDFMANDDLEHELGDPHEEMLRTALQLLERATLQTDLIAR